MDSTASCLKSLRHSVVGASAGLEDVHPQPNLRPSEHARSATSLIVKDSTEYFLDCPEASSAESDVTEAAVTELRSNPRSTTSPSNVVSGTSSLGWEVCASFLLVAPDLVAVCPTQSSETRRTSKRKGIDAVDQRSARFPRPILSGTHDATPQCVQGSNGAEDGESSTTSESSTTIFNPLLLGKRLNKNVAGLAKTVAYRFAWGLHGLWRLPTRAMHLILRPFPGRKSGRYSHAGDQTQRPGLAPGATSVSTAELHHSGSPWVFPLVLSPMQTDSDPTFTAAFTCALHSAGRSLPEPASGVQGDTHTGALASRLVTRTRSISSGMMTLYPPLTPASAVAADGLQWYHVTDCRLRLLTPHERSLYNETMQENSVESERGRPTQCPVSKTNTLRRLWKRILFKKKSKTIESAVGLRLSDLSMTSTTGCVLLLECGSLGSCRSSAMNRDAGTNTYYATNARLSSFAPTLHERHDGRTAASVLVERIEHSATNEAAQEHASVDASRVSSYSTDSCQALTISSQRTAELGINGCTPCVRRYIVDCGSEAEASRILGEFNDLKMTYRGDAPQKTGQPVSSNNEYITSAWSSSMHDVQASDEGPAPALLCDIPSARSSSLEGHPLSLASRSEHAVLRPTLLQSSPPLAGTEATGSAPELRLLSPSVSKPRLSLSRTSLPAVSENGFSNATETGMVQQTAVNNGCIDSSMWDSCLATNVTANNFPRSPLLIPQVLIAPSRSSMRFHAAPPSFCNIAMVPSLQCEQASLQANIATSNSKVSANNQLKGNADSLASTLSVFETARAPGHNKVSTNRSSFNISAIQDDLPVLARMETRTKDAVARYSPVGPLSNLDRTKKSFRETTELSPTLTSSPKLRPHARALLHAQKNIVKLLRDGCRAPIASTSVASVSCDEQVAIDTQEDRRHLHIRPGELTAHGNVVPPRMDVPSTLSAIESLLDRSLSVRIPGIRNSVLEGQYSISEHRQVCNTPAFLLLPDIPTSPTPSSLLARPDVQKKHGGGTDGPGNRQPHAALDTRITGSIRRLPQGKSVSITGSAPTSNMASASLGIKIDIGSLSPLIPLVRTVSYSHATHVPKGDDGQYRWKIFAEIYETEKRFVRDMQVLVEHFLQPLRDEANTMRPIISAAKLDIIFSNIENILDVNATLLRSISDGLGLMRLALVHNQEENDAEIESQICNVFCDAFLLVAPFFQLYSIYVKSFPFALDILRTELPENENLQGFLQFSFLKPAVKQCFGSWTDMAALLIKPVQRITKYPLFFRDILKHMSRGSPSRDKVERALEQVEKAAAIVNAKVAAEERQQRVVDILALLDGADSISSLVQPSRRLLLDIPDVAVAFGRPNYGEDSASIASSIGTPGSADSDVTPMTASSPASSQGTPQLDVSIGDRQDGESLRAVGGFRPRRKNCTSDYHSAVAHAYISTTMPGESGTQPVLPNGRLRAKASLIVLPTGSVGSPMSPRSDTSAPQCTPTPRIVDSFEQPVMTNTATASEAPAPASQDITLILNRRKFQKMRVFLLNDTLIIAKRRRTVPYMPFSASPSTFFSVWHSAAASSPVTVIDSGSTSGRLPGVVEGHRYRLVDVIDLRNVSVFNPMANMVDNTLSVSPAYVQGTQITIASHGASAFVGTPFNPTLQSSTTGTNASKPQPSDSLGVSNQILRTERGIMMRRKTLSSVPSLQISGASAAQQFYNATLPPPAPSSSSVCAPVSALKILQAPVSLSLYAGNALYAGISTAVSYLPFIGSTSAATKAVEDEQARKKLARTLTLNVSRLHPSKIKVEASVGLSSLSTLLSAMGLSPRPWPETRDLAAASLDKASPSLSDTQSTSRILLFLRFRDEATRANFEEVLTASVAEHRSRIEDLDQRRNRRNHSEDSMLKSASQPSQNMELEASGGTSVCLPRFDSEDDDASETAPGFLSMYKHYAD